MKLVDLLRELLALQTPSAAVIRRAIAGRDLTPAVHTINVRDDALGRGSYAELVVNEPARVKDLATVVSKLAPAPRTPGDTLSGTKLVADGGATRVFVELVPGSADRIAFVTIQFKTQ